MARLFEVKEFAARKRALAAENEVYRQTLTLEVRNLRLYSGALERRLAPWRRLGVVLPFAGAAAGFWWRRRQKPSPPRMLGKVVAGWQIYRTLLPLLRPLAGRLLSRRVDSPNKIQTP